MDPFDSLVWLGCQFRSVAYYDQRTKLINVIPIHNATKIIFKQDAVYFTGSQGFSYWNRKTKVASQIQEIPNKFIGTSSMPDDSTIILENKYKYHFKSGRVVQGDFSKEKRNAGRRVLRSKNGITVYENNDFKWYNFNWFEYKGKVGVIPFSKERGYNIQILNQKIWNIENSTCQLYDPLTEKTTTLTYRLPKVNNYGVHYNADDQYLWMIRPGQVFMINISNKKLFDYPILENEEHQTSIFDEFNVYSLYRHKIVISSKEDFFKHSVEFNVGKYENELEQFNNFVDSIGIRKDTIAYLVLDKLNNLKRLYDHVNHPEILEKLNRLDVEAFYHVDFTFPDGLEACYRDTLIPISQRKKCIQSLIDQYGTSQQYRKVVALEVLC